MSSFSDDFVTIHHGDCLDVMATMDAESVDSIVTDPPYGLGFMGRDWDHGVPGEHFWREALRVAKPGAHLVAFGGTRTYHRLGCAIEDAGWEIRDGLGWLYGSGFPKSLNLDGEHKGWGTALKPAWEPIILARKPLVSTVAACVQKHGTGALNIDGCRVEYESPEDMAAAAAAAEIRSKQTDRNFDGWGMRDQQISRDEYMSGPAGLGRWPANIIHDGSDEVLSVFPQQISGANPTRRGAPKFRNTYSEFAGQAECAPARGPDAGSAARFFYTAKATKAERDDGLFGEPQEAGIKNASGRGFSGRDPYAKQMRRNIHPTVKPIALMRWLVRLVTPPDGIVLDPFMGSGTTLKAARAEGHQSIGIDLEASHCEIAWGRLSQGVLL